MKKMIDNSGFMLAETLIVTAFVAGVLIFIYIQFANLNKNYNVSYSYNKIQDLYALDEVKYMIEEDSEALTYIHNNVNSVDYLNITSCSIFTSEEYCLELFELVGLEKILITTNNIDEISFDNLSDLEFLDFINNIKFEGSQKYRLIAKFKNSTYATIRFGD